MTTEAETYTEEPITSNSINKPIIEKIDEENENNKIELSNDEALDIQINFLKSSTKNIFYPFFQSEQDNISKSVEIRHINRNKNNQNIDEGIYLYLQNIYDKYYTNEMEYIIKSINNKISYVNEKNKEYLQNKKFVERETNTVSQEKIDYFNEKENLDKELELLQVNASQNVYNDKMPSLNIKMNRNKNISNNNEIIDEINDIEITKKTKKLEDLKTKYNKIFDDISANKKEFPIIKNKNSMVQGENMILNEKLKQKRMIWDQLRRENEKIRTVVIKRDYNNLETDNKKNKKKDDKEKDKEKEKKSQSKNLKVSKIGTFLIGFMGNNKK